MTLSRCQRVPVAVYSLLLWLVLVCQPPLVPCAGRIGEATSLLAWASPSENDTLVFEASDCVVSSPDTVITCHTSAGVGQHLVWQVEVEGLLSTTPTSGYLAPNVTSVVSMAQLQQGEAFIGMSTLGGEVVDIVGNNFGTLCHAVSAQCTCACACAWIHTHLYIHTLKRMDSLGFH